MGWVDQAPSHATTSNSLLMNGICRRTSGSPPPRLPLPDHVHYLVSLDRSPRRLKLAKPLLGLYSSFDRSMILLRMLFKYWPGRWR